MPRRDLHPAQSKLLELLTANSMEPLTIRELQERLGASSTSVVVHHISQLEKKGYLKRNPYNPRVYHVVEHGPEAEVAHVNLYGMARCGPGGSILDGDPIDRVPIAARLLSFPASEAFMMKAKGASMLPRIQEGDLVIARKTSIAQDGKVFVCINNEECLIKLVRLIDGRVFLESFNRDAFPIFAAGDDFRVEGEVRHVMSGRI